MTAGHAPGRLRIALRVGEKKMIELDADGTTLMFLDLALPYALVEAYLDADVGLERTGGGRDEAFYRTGVDLEPALYVARATDTETSVGLRVHTSLEAIHQFSIHRFERVDDLDALAPLSLLAAGTKCALQ